MSSTPGQPEQLVAELNRRLASGQPMSNVSEFQFEGFDLIPGTSVEANPMVRIRYTYRGEPGHSDHEIWMWDREAVILEQEGVARWANAFEATDLWGVVNAITGADEAEAWAQLQP